MNRSTFALFVALLIHLILFLLFWIFFKSVNTDIDKHIQKKEHRIKISLKEPPKLHKKSGLTKKKIPTPKIAPPMPKGSQLKKIIQPKKHIKYEPTQPKKVPQLNKPKIKPVQKKTVHTVPLTKPKKFITMKKEPEKKPMAWLYEDKSAEEPEKKKKVTTNNSNISQNIKKLYGEEFGKLSPGQQKYILDNQEIMRRITQQVLNRVARVNLPHDLNINRTNVVEFKLHPNGDMSDFKFLSKSGYYVLDDTTKETIEYAYSRYPRPTETTLIRYNVYYNLARY